MRFFSSFIAFTFLVIIGSTNSQAQNITYQDGNNGWDPDSLGNHRFVIQLAAPQYQLNRQVVKVVIPWRRSDKDPAAFAGNRKGCRRKLRPFCQRRRG